MQPRRSPGNFTSSQTKGAPRVERGDRHPLQRQFFAAHADFSAAVPSSQQGLFFIRESVESVTCEPPIGEVTFFVQRGLHAS